MNWKKPRKAQCVFLVSRRGEVETASPGSAQKESLCRESGKAAGRDFRVAAVETGVDGRGGTLG